LSRNLSTIKVLEARVSRILKYGESLKNETLKTAFEGKLLQQGQP